MMRRVIRDIIPSFLLLTGLVIAPCAARGADVAGESVSRAGTEEIASESGLTAVDSVMRCPETSEGNFMPLPHVSQQYDKGDFKVGLVLSGGGAKGIAHIGVIQALEENDIPIDCIAGTSMGAVVGSLYSIGMSPRKMMEFIKSPIFQNCATGTLDPDLVYYFSRPQPTPAWASVNINFKDTVSGSLTNQIIPTSLISPLPMNIEFLELYAPYTSQCGQDFDRLMVPFRCVTSDVYHKHKIVLDSGNLGRAVRASMSFPMVFRPIEIDSVLVYDGGIYDNFPVDVMQDDFDPDFIIGVSVSSPDGKPQKNNLFSQVEDMIIQNNNYSVPADKGIKIQCPVLNFGVLDFDQADVIYDIGYRTGLEMVDSIKRRTAARRSEEMVERRRAQFASQTPELMFDSVAVSSGTPGQRAFLRFLFDRGFPGRPFGLDQTQNAYYQAISGGKLRNLMPEVEFGRVDSLDPLVRKNNTLLLQPEIKSPWNIGVGGWLSTGTQSMLYLNLGYHTLSYNSLDVDLSGWVGQSYYAGMLSGKFTVHSRMPAYLKLEGVISSRKFYDSQLMFYQDNTPTFITDIERFVKLHYCLATSRKSVATASIAYGLKKYKYYPGADEIDYTADRRDVSRTKVAAIGLGWEYNTMTAEMYPMSGRQFKASFIGEWQRADYLPQDEKSAMVKYRRHYRASLEVIWRHYYPATSISEPMPAAWPHSARSTRPTSPSLWPHPPLLRHPLHPITSIRASVQTIMWPWGLIRCGIRSTSSSCEATFMAICRCAISRLAPTAWRATPVGSIIPPLSARQPQSTTSPSPHCRCMPTTSAVRTPTGTSV